MRTLVVFCLFLAVTPIAWAQDTGVADDPVSFADDVQPILRRNCYRCHGSKNQEADLQLNDRSLAFGDADTPIINKHDADASLLIARLIDDDQGDIMPLDGQPLQSGEVDVLRRWINQGAQWPDEYAKPKHWAYQPIKRPAVPDDAKWNGESNSCNAVDQFVLRRLKQRGLHPSLPLDSARLIRRVSLALTGIPPTPKEVRAFSEDNSPDAYEHLIDRLIDSPRYGERWAVPWLDLARYADSNGFQADQIRDNWAYRDWVIRSFNNDLPFNEFVIDQLAGDLRPRATNDQRIATGFHRMTTCNVEAGVHPEANRTNQIVDRVNTTATVFMGTTLECAQCHDHKYDPFSQKDYYRLFAYFNNTPLEVKNTSGVTWDFYGPKMDLPISEARKAQQEKLSQAIAALKSDRAQTMKHSDNDFDAWLTSIRNASESLPEWDAVAPHDFLTTGKETVVIQDDASVLLSGPVPQTVEHTFSFVGTKESNDQPITAIKIELLTDDSIPGKGPGRGDPVRRNVIISEITCELIRDDTKKTVTLQNAVADFSQKNWSVSQAIDRNRKKGWAISPQFGKPHWASFVLSQPIALNDANQTFNITLGQFYGQGRVAGKLRVSFFRGDPLALSLDESLRKLAAKKSLSKQGREKLRKQFDTNNPLLNQIDQEIAQLQKQLDELTPDTTLVMVEMSEPRETFVMVRGDYETLADKVTPGAPDILPPPKPDQQTGDRMELAMWLTSPDNPLLARVTVNRWWAELFGTGLVNTPEDFGTQSEAPSHPLLLDWLASELIDSNWSMKHVHKQIVMSATFQQESRLSPELKKADPKNRMLARGPRFRLPAETIRDNALAISGLLSNKMFGPPIMPFQPNDIWRSVGRNQPTWKAAENDDRFRRGVYVICKRAAPYPSFINFDAPDRGNCTVRRGRTNTPLQALTLLNDPAYAEMALAMADRILSESANETDQSRLRYAMRLSVAREPSTYEISILNQLLDRERALVRDNASVVLQRTKVPFDGMKLQSNDKAELAAWFAVTNALLNLDETMSQ